MSSSFKENIKIGLLGVIAVTLTINTYLQIPNKAARSRNLNNTGNSPVKEQETNITTDSEHSSFVGPSTTIQFSETEHSYGKIKQDSKNMHTFKFTNTGSEPLVIENAVGSCGCTVPEYPKEPIAPGKSSQITVEYSPGKQQGLQNKTVTVTANTEPKTSVLNISADVISE